MFKTRNNKEWFPECGQEVVLYITSIEYDPESGEIKERSEYKGIGCLDEHGWDFAMYDLEHKNTEACCWGLTESGKAPDTSINEMDGSLFMEIIREWYYVPQKCGYDDEQLLGILKEVSSKKP